MLWVIHHDDMDGRCSGAVVNRWHLAEGIDEAKFIESGHVKRPDLSGIKKGDMVVIVDYSLKDEEMVAVRKAVGDGGRVVWIDHHKTNLEGDQAGLVDSGEVEGVLDDSKAACELAWEHFFPGEEPPLAVILIGDFDTWTLGIPESLDFQYGMLSRECGPEDDIWEELLTAGEGADQDAVVDEIVGDGEIIGRYRDRVMETYREEMGFECEFEGHKCYALNAGLFASLAFGDLIKEYDICIAFVFNGEKWKITMYSKKVDVSEIAVKHGGGGHEGAAGFSADALPFVAKKAP
jgi:oligoribonuclease NrnB/cAMP/cGMP phosphodiesterase (DHH superfamily)